MLRDRGYQIDEDKINQDYDSFKEYITAKPNSLSMFAFRENAAERQKFEKLLENPEENADEIMISKPKKEPIYVCFATE